MIKGVALTIEATGLITSIIRNDGILGGGDIFLNQNFTNFIIPEDLVKFFDFIIQIKQKGAVFNCEINSNTIHGIKTINYGGVITSDVLLIVATDTKNGSEIFYSELIRINNEQTNILRNSVKDKSPSFSPENDFSLFDELSRLNNELATTQRELAKKNIELAGLNQLKNQFLGIAAHDLRNPIGVVLGFSELLLDDVNIVDAENRTMITHIRSASEFMLELVNNLLDISSIESGKLNLNKQQVDLVGLIEKNIEFNRVFSRKKHINLIYEKPTSEIHVMLDVSKIDQALNNLISNALKFSFPQTTITITSEPEENGLVKISVKDEGQGIPAAELENLFKPFNKTSVRSTSGETNTGLGLTIVRKIIEAHGGKTGVTSVPGSGSTFYFELPLRNDEITKQQ